MSNSLTYSNDDDTECHRRKYRHRRSNKFSKSHSYKYLKQQTIRSKRTFFEMADPDILHRAVYHCDKHVVEALVLSGFDVNTLNDQCDAPAHIAAARGYLGLYRYLVANNADIGIRDRDGRTPLHIVAENGNPDIEGQYLQLAEFTIIECNANVNALDARRHTPLHMAVKSCSYDIADLLLQNGAIVDFPNFEGKTALHFAIFRKNLRIVNLLLRCGADPSIRCNNGFTYLYYAVRSGCHAIVESLLEYRADIDESISLESSLSVTMSRPCLHVAIERNNAEIVEMLLGRDADIEAQDAAGNGPLHVAAKAGREQIIRLLLNNGANINQVDGRGVTPLYVALENERDSIFELLLHHGAGWTTRGQCGFTMLHSAIRNRDLNLFRILLSKNKIDLDSQDYLGRTPLHHAVEERTLGFSALLLEHGAPVNAKCGLGKTPFHTAIENGRIPVYKILVRHGADVNAVDADLRTPLHYAMFRGCYIAAEILLRNNANVNAVNKNGETPLHFAIKFRQTHMIELLISHKVDLNMVDGLGYSPLHLCVIHESSDLTSGSLEDSFFYALVQENVDLEVKTVNNDEYTPLHWAVKRDCANFVKQLLLYGANVNSVDKRKRTPLHLAVKAGHRDCIEQLLLHNANVEAQDSDDMIPLYYSPNGRVDKIFERYWIKRTSVGFKVADFAIEYIYDDEEEKREEEIEKCEFVDRCSAEVARLRETKLCENVTFYEFLRLPIRRLVKYAKKTEVASVFERRNHKESFPIYADMLEKSFLTGKRFGDYMDKITMTIFIATNFRFNEDIVDTIVNFFTLKEMRNLVHLGATAATSELQTES